MPETLILVADAARARLFAARRNARWQLVRAFEHPRSAMKTSELVSDRRGRLRQPAGESHRTAADPRTDPKTVEMQAFARELAGALETVVTARHAPRVALVAPPKFLGELRDALGTPVRQVLSGSLDSDLTGLADHELPARLSDLL